MSRFEVKATKGGYLEAVVAGIVVGLACNVPVLLSDLGSVRFLVNITTFSLAASWADGGLKKP
jgi:hypothetical protein